MKLKALLDVLIDTQPIHIYVNDGYDFEILAAKIKCVSEKFLAPMWNRNVTGIFTDDVGTLIVGLKGDDDDESVTS